MEPELIDEIECGNFFDQMDDLIEFPPDNECADDANLVSSSDFPTWDEALQGCDTLFSGSPASDLAAELSVPYEDIVQLEWLSTFVEDSFSGGGLTVGKEKKEQLSPVSVVESSTSSSSSSAVPLSPRHRGPQRARSKRPRPPMFNPRPAIQLISPASSESNSFAESSPSKKSKKIKITLPATPTPQPLRKCLHCEITKTPQWRAGPMGPKTLCNACGVRYKSGRLFPEYRPAASPTFVPSLHSNSHKKVIEMRCKVEPMITSL
ncbi:GATA transcription factor 8-like [Salvia miltiorrhiza]|uniref:GATA transcription factor 8-like n=1 Tax=Salvia miltiorrhiza TaxID=226208 RepID=UPI0025ABBFF2|nr:GATA transcription factor 8-like [Salvia miltiorrhiza]